MYADTQVRIQNRSDLYAETAVELPSPSDPAFRSAGGRSLAGHLTSLELRRATAVPKGER